MGQVSRGESDGRSTSQCFIVLPLLRELRHQWLVSEEGRRGASSLVDLNLGKPALMVASTLGSLLAYILHLFVYNFGTFGHFLDTNCRCRLICLLRRGVGSG
jgi:hypothetical protein